MVISPQITHLIVKRILVSNACNTNFRLFIVLGDELLIARVIACIGIILRPIFRQCLKEIPFVLYL